MDGDSAQRERDRDFPDWPNRDASRFVTAGGLTWHVQELGEGPTILMLHGTGATTHSWAALAPLLAASHKVVAADLPGHGFTDTASNDGMSLPGMAALVGELMTVLDETPQFAIGHSAGAAVLVRAALDHHLKPEAIISLNGALLPMRGLAGQIFSPLAKFLFANPLAADLFAWRASSARAVERLIEGTGSTLDAAGLSFYERLFKRQDHVSGALAMMANWDLARLRSDLPRLDTPLILMTADNDRAISPADARDVQVLVPSAEIVKVSGLGHLAHEEDPGLVADLIRRRLSPGDGTA